MASKRIKGITIEIDGNSTKLQNSLKDVDSTLSETQTSLRDVNKLLKFDPKNTELLNQKQKLLKESIENTSDRLKKLRDAEKDVQQAVAEGKSSEKQYNALKREIVDTERKLREFEDAAKSSNNNLKELSKTAQSVGDHLSSASGKLQGASAGAAGIIGGVAATVPATEEHRKIMGTLQTSSEMAGYSASQTTEIYENLFSVLGDDQTAATTAANLQALGLSQNDLMQMTNGAIGAWATYGDSIPIDSLSEAINETAQVGKVTGTFADVLNWAGTSEDDFNAKLATCGDKTERANLIMQELANQGLIQASDAWKQNNDDIVASNTATGDMQEAVSNLAETIAPIVTTVTGALAGLIEKFNGLDDGHQKVVLGIIGIIAILAPLLGAISSVIGIVSALSGALGLLGVPILPLIALIAGLTLVGVALYKNWDEIKAKAGELKEAVIGKWTEIKTNVSETVEGIKTKASDAWDSIKTKTSDAFENVKTTIKNAIDKVKGFFDFDWHLPHIDLPHFSLEGEFSLKPPSVPHLSVDWYDKAMDKVHMLQGANIFGAMNGRLLGGGESGSEMVVGTAHMMELIQKATASSNQAVINAVDGLARLVVERMDAYFPRFVNDKVIISGRSFRRLLTDEGVVFS